MTTTDPFVPFTDRRTDKRLPAPDLSPAERAKLRHFSATPHDFRGSDFAGGKKGPLLDSPTDDHWTPPRRGVSAAPDVGDIVRLVAVPGDEAVTVYGAGVFRVIEAEPVDGLVTLTLSELRP